MVSARARVRVRVCLRPSQGQGRRLRSCKGKGDTQRERAKVRVRVKSCRDGWPILDARLGLRREELAVDLATAGCACARAQSQIRDR